MTWRDRKTQARYRGILFHVEEHDRSGSRRYVVTEVPQGDDPVIQDMGAGLRRFRVEGFLLGDDYMPRRDALIAALEEAGPGPLTHPWHGQQRVVAESYSVREGVGAGGRVDFSIQFLRVGPLQGRKRHGTTRSSRIAAVDTAADKLAATAQSDFAGNLIVAGAAGFVADAAEEEVRSMVGRIENQARHLQGKGASLLRRVRDMVDEPLQELLNPSGFASDLFEAVNEVGVGIKSRETALRVLIGLAERTPSESRGQSGQAEIAKKNSAAFSGLLGSTALGMACKRAASEDWASRDAALDARGRLVDMIDEQGHFASHVLWEDLHGLRAAISDVLPGPQGELPALRTIELDSAEPSLVVAYRAHGSIEGVSALVERNGIEHPSFVPAGSPVEVLASV